ncbi:hypothetical protein TNCT_379941 [Trichonephila clavata]|uniref:Uncharacterized protein n=1 Tax=Trichonephila clavata TaxID=2740835 RepID=A0A8X6FNR5_TRICU|nr:hypothetical protein TNCT_379941 [Trichonephila clavata]
MPRTKAFGKLISFYYGQNNDHAEQLVNESNEKVCTSKFKIESASEMLDDIPFDDQSSVNIVIDLDIISKFLKSMARCKYCNKCDSLIITEDARSRRGLCVSLTLQCIFCGQAFSSMSSNPTNGVYDINVRSAYGLRCIGVMDAVVTFNDGAQSRIRVLDEIGLKPGLYMRKALRIIDNKRVCEAEIAMYKASKEARIRNKREKQNKNLEKSNKLDYSAGLF